MASDGNVIKITGMGRKKQLRQLFKKQVKMAYGFESLDVDSPDLLAMV